MLRFGELTPRHLAQEVIEDRTVVDAMGRVDVTYSVELDPLCQQRDDHQQAARVTVVTRDGSSTEEMIAAPTGVPARPMSSEQIDAKFVACVSGRGGVEGARRLLARVKSIATLRNVRALFA